MGDSGEDWKEWAKKTLTTYYMSFQGLQWHTFDRQEEELNLLVVKLCYALFGPPEKNNNMEEDDGIEKAYKVEQRKTAREIMNVILKEHDRSKAKALRIGFAFVACKMKDSKFLVPVFSVSVGVSSDSKDMAFVDAQCRTYKSWEDWIKNNKLPDLDYCYPQDGYFTCTPGKIEFDPEKAVLVKFGESPAASLLSKGGTATDIVSSVVSLGCGVVGVVGLFTPLAPVVATTAFVAGASCGVYGAAR